ncbi:hypothetical protein SARC_04533 [Sphaeroforma arctica JP610]|uniref:Uncharacterized protein n=1 Tax=Sphaeroforma arctica JP610 TaxID=667725 RepID=A0A0L0G2Y1_9EUKA|nr:hypothetical protein SARC_04533 [Sphaeroforma arctica JP610]KNC83199.1 hypothetical protein SARC_04533 [Sphaeroforma arctica JP610]|eukprot:XP_014157101.1 hypothetical protein SARC_04533 [Sphaeroforma arctica JP610]
MCAGLWSVMSGPWRVESGVRSVEFWPWIPGGWIPGTPGSGSMDMTMRLYESPLPPPLLSLGSGESGNWKDPWCLVDRRLTGLL